MADFATLVYDIDSSQAAGAAKVLLQLERASASAASSAAKLERQARGSDGRFKSNADAAKENAAQIENLAQKYNPLLAAQLSFSRAEREVAEAVRLGVIAADQKDAVLERLSTQYTAASMSANRYSAAMSGVNNIQGSVGNQFAQLNDVVVTAWGGMNPALIGMQQGMQMVQGFAGQSMPQALASLRGAFLQLLNPVTLVTIAAVAAGAALIQWGTSVFMAGEQTKTFNDRLVELEASTQRVNEASRIYTTGGLEDLRQKYGEITVELNAMIAAQTQFAINQAMEDSRAAISALRNEYVALQGSVELYAATGRGDFAALSVQLGLSKDQVIELGRALNDASRADTFEDQAAALSRVNAILGKSSISTKELYGNLLDAEDAVRQLAESAPKSNWMNAAISGVMSLGDAIRGRISEAMQLAAAANSGMTTGNSDWAKGQLGFNLPGKELLPTSAGGGGGGGGRRRGGGGGGGGVSDAQRAWDQLNKVEQDGLMKDLETLKWGLDQKLITEKEYYIRRNEMITLENGIEFEKDQVKFQQEMDTLSAHLEQKLITEENFLIRQRQLQWKYAAELQEGQNNRWSVELDGMAAGFGRMNELAGGGYDRLLQAQKIFSAASALMSTYTGAAKALELPFPQNLIAMGKVLAAGMGLVSAIKGGGGGAGKGSAASTATTATRQEPTRNVLIRLQGDDWLTSLAESMMTQIYEGSKNGRVIIARDF